MTAFDPGSEFDRQLANLVARGYPELAGRSEEEYVRLLSPLRPVAADMGGSAQPPSRSRVPFVLVPAGKLAPPRDTMPRTTLAGGTAAGFVDRTYPEGDLERFQPVPGLGIPSGEAYLAFDVDRGEEWLNARPDDAMVTVLDRGRSPLTVEEGIALITQFPETLEKNRCFSLGGSRCGDRRVPALWISKRAPKLGWCWGGNPHTWLGLASCADRAGA